MDWQSVDTATCSVGRTLAVVGEKWSLLVLRDAFNGLRRYDDLRRHLGVSDAVLADRLRTLVGAGVLERRDYQEPGRRTQAEYVVTDAGWELQPVVVGLLQWGDRHLPAPEGPLVEVRHRGCGGAVEAVVRCAEDGLVLSPRETRLVPGRGMRLLTGSAGSQGSTGSEGSTGSARSHA